MSNLPLPTLVAGVNDDCYLNIQSGLRVSHLVSGARLKETFIQVLVEGFTIAHCHPVIQFVRDAKKTLSVTSEIDNQLLCYDDQHYSIAPLAAGSSL